MRSQHVLQELVGRSIFFLFSRFLRKYVPRWSRPPAALLVACPVLRSSSSPVPRRRCTYTMTLADEIERSGAFRDVIRASNRQESEIARLRDAFAAKSNRGERKLKLYHGTSLENAERIKRDGFLPSSHGCLGPGVYVGHMHKALRFAQDGSRHGALQGGLIEVLVRFSQPKFVTSDDHGWRDEGYDACRADHTSASTHMG